MTAAHLDITTTLNWGISCFFKQIITGKEKL